jgi:hypothetical protein
MALASFQRPMADGWIGGGALRGHPSAGGVAAVGELHGPVEALVHLRGQVGQQRIPASPGSGDRLWDVAVHNHGGAHAAAVPARAP